MFIIHDGNISAEESSFYVLRHTTSSAETNPSSLRPQVYSRIHRTGPEFRCQDSQLNNRYSVGGSLGPQWYLWTAGRCAENGKPFVETTGTSLNVVSTLDIGSADKLFEMVVQRETMAVPG